jgi:nitrite reductase/ring-hydroxylating ferredoxin subunit
VIPHFEPRWMLRRMSGSPDRLARAIPSLTMDLSPQNGLWWIEVGPDPVPDIDSRCVVQVPMLGLDLLVVRTRRGVFACANRCTRRCLSLTQARITTRTIACPEHDWKFRLRDGRCLTRGTGGRPTLTVWPARIDAGVLYIRVPLSAHRRA